MWMRRKHPSIPLERYADDVVCHCQSEDQAKELWRELKGRFSECGLELHPEKTKIVYCKDNDRRGNYFDQALAAWLGHWTPVGYNANCSTGRLVPEASGRCLRRGR